ncbi:hypothetical protein CCP3SC1_2320003 [Gammaproteobacteria bacterium]
MRLIAGMHMIDTFLRVGKRTVHGRLVR